MGNLLLEKGYGKKCGGKEKILRRYLDEQIKRLYCGEISFIR